MKPLHIKDDAMPNYSHTKIDEAKARREQTNHAPWHVKVMWKTVCYILKNGDPQKSIPILKKIPTTWLCKLTDQHGASLIHLAAQFSQFSQFSQLDKNAYENQDNHYKHININANANENANENENQNANINETLFELALKKGGDINSTDAIDNRHTVLHYLLKNKSFTDVPPSDNEHLFCSTLNQIKKYQFDFNFQDEFGDGIVFQLIKTKHHYPMLNNFIPWLYQNNPEKFKEYDHTGAPLLVVSAIYKNEYYGFPITSLLLPYCDPADQDKQCRNALHAAYDEAFSYHKRNDKRNNKYSSNPSTPSTLSTPSTSSAPLTPSTPANDALQLVYLAAICHPDTSALLETATTGHDKGKTITQRLEHHFPPDNPKMAFLRESSLRCLSEKLTHKPKLKN